MRGPAAPLQLMLRTTAARICRSGSRPASLRGIVRDSAFHGRGYDYVIELGEGLRLTAAAVAGAHSATINVTANEESSPQS